MPYPRDREGVLGRLLAERKRDDVSGSYSIRNVGALLLAKRLSALPGVARKAPRVVVYAGDSKLQTRLERTDLRGYAVGFQGLLTGGSLRGRVGDMEASIGRGSCDAAG